MIVTTTNDVAGYRIVLSVVRGITVRSRSVIGNIGAGIQSLFGGNITIDTNLAKARGGVRTDGPARHLGRDQRLDRDALRRQRDHRRWPDCDAAGGLPARRP